MKQDLFGREVLESEEVEEGSDLVEQVVGGAGAFSPVWVNSVLLEAMNPIARRMGCMPHELFTIFVAFGVAHEEELVEYIERMKKQNGVKS